MRKPFQVDVLPNLSWIVHSKFVNMGSTLISDQVEIKLSDKSSVSDRGLCTLELAFIDRAKSASAFLVVKQKVQKGDRSI